MKPSQIISMIICYSGGLLLSLAGTFYILMHAGGHGGGKGMWFDALMVPGIYLAALYPPDTIYLAIILYSVVIGSFAYLPLKMLFKW